MEEIGNNVNISWKEAGCFGDGEFYGSYTVFEKRKRKYKKKYEETEKIKNIYNGNVRRGN